MTLLMAQVDAERQCKLARETDWKMVEGFVEDDPGLHVVRTLPDGSKVKPYKPLKFAKEKLREKALLRQYKMHGELHVLKTEQIEDRTVMMKMEARLIKTVASE